MTAFVLTLLMAAALAVTAYAASVTVKYREFVYSGQITFRQYDYSQSTTPSITNLTISATSSLGSGSALYHMKYADGAVAYCIEPGVHSDDSGTYKEGSSASWYNLPASVQSGIALAMSLGYPSADYGAASGDRNSSAIINYKYDITKASNDGAWDAGPTFPPACTMMPPWTSWQSMPSRAWSSPTSAWLTSP